MTQAATAFVEFEGDFTKIGRNAGGQAKQLEGTFNSSFKRIATFAAGAIAGIGLGKVLKDSFAEAEESQKVGRQTAAVIKSTGAVAHVSAKQVDDLSNSLSAKAGIDDEVIASGEDVLLTFTKVRNEVGKGNDIFTQATGAALDMSRALGTDLQGTVLQVGKALNDPIKGVTALARAGVSFTAQQKDQIKTLVASGKTLDAQKIILGELTKEFGGAAAAVASPSEKLGVAFKNIEESLGLIFLPLVNKLSSFLTVTVSPAIQRLIPILTAMGQAALLAIRIGFGGTSIDGIHGWLRVFAEIGVVVREVVAFVTRAWDDLLAGFENPDASIGKSVDGIEAFFLRLGAAVSKIVSFVQRNWKPVLVAAVAALALFFAPITTTIAGLVALYVRFALVRTIVGDVVTAVQIASHFLASLPWGQIFSDVADTISTAVGVIETVVGHVVGFFHSHANDFAAFGKQLAAVWRQLAPTVKAAFTAVVAIVKVALALIVIPIIGAVKFLTELWDRFGHQLLDHLRIAFNAVVLIVRGALQIIQGIFEIVTGILTGKWGKVWDGLKDIVAGAGKLIVGEIKFLLNEISTVLGLGVAVISEVWDGLWDHMRGFVVAVFNAIVAFIRRWGPTILAVLTGGLSLVVTAFVTHFGQIRSTVSNVIGDVVGFFAGLPGRILSFIGKVASAAASIGAAILGGIKDGITGALGFVVDVGKAIANAAIGFVNRIIDDINNALEIRISLPFGKHFSLNPPDIPHIPLLDTGAVVGSPTLALLAGGAKAQPEIVTPERLMAKVFSDVIAANKGRGFTDARTIVEGNVYGDAHLQGIFDDHDRKLEHALAAG